ncbi:MAG: glycosyl transferase family 1 [Nitrospinaceae bacterium]|nr:MAG: glycosyl transferase family 1 [Nitrospinaceae bacterium]
MSKRIAILYDCPFPYVQGGGQRRLFEIARNLLQKGWEVEWFALQFWEGPKTIQHKGITYTAVGRGVELYGPGGKRRIWETIYYGLMIMKHTELRHFDVIHAGQWPFFHLVPARLYSLFGRAKLVVDWWEVWGTAHWLEYYGAKGIIGSGFEKLLTQIAPNIIAITRKGKNQLKRLGVKETKVNFIPNGIDFEKIQNARAKEKDFDLVFMGRLNKHKSVDHLLHVVSILQKAGTQVTLQIIGEGPEKLALEKLAEQLEIANRVTFHGMISSDAEAYSWMKASRLFVHPIHKGGGGSITVLEANACGLPVVAYKHEKGISEELIDEGVNGYWVTKTEPKALAEKISFLLSDKGLGQSLKTSAFEHAKQYAWASIAEVYNGYFMELIDSKK